MSSKYRIKASYSLARATKFVRKSPSALLARMLENRQREFTCRRAERRHYQIVAGQARCLLDHRPVRSTTRA